MFKRVKELVEVLNSGWDPNSDGGWPIRLAARYGCCLIVETFIQHGADPHLVSESGKFLPHHYAHLLNNKHNVHVLILTFD